MCALFTDLHDVAQVLTEHIRHTVGVTDVQPGPPRDAGAATDAGARITLVYATPQPPHRNDPVHAQPNGALRSPPLSLTCFYLLTTSGADADDPIAAHHVLGRVMTVYHDNPTLHLPLSQSPDTPSGNFSDLGDGPLNVVQVPMTLEQIDKIWTSMDVQLQPWALFEVGPVQLVSLVPDAAPAPVVRPDGIVLRVSSLSRPLITRITPGTVRPGGRVRIEAVLPGGLDAAGIDDVTVSAGDTSLVEADGGTTVLLTLDEGGLEGIGEGMHRVTVRSAGLISAAVLLDVTGPGAVALDAPATAGHDPAVDLVLTGANLQSVQQAVLWPDQGLATPSDVHSLPLQAVSAADATVASAGLAALAALPGGRGPWRLALQLTAEGTDSFTPYVLLELMP